MVNTLHSTHNLSFHHDAPAGTSLRERLQGLKLDRATALALAFCVNVGILVTLTLPSEGETTLSMLVPEADKFTVVDLTPDEPKVEESEPPPPPVPPERRPAIEPEPVLRPIIKTPSPMAKPVEPTETQVEQTTPSRATTVEPTQPGPSSALNREAGVRYGIVPPPEYPRIALKQGLQGTVVLLVLVSKSGSVLDVQIEQSSGHRELDRAAERQVGSRWQFQPALQDGQPIEAWVKVPLVFKLHKG